MEELYLANWIYQQQQQQSHVYQVRAPWERLPFSEEISHSQTIQLASLTLTHLLTVTFP